MDSSSFSKGFTPKPVEARSNDDSMFIVKEPIPQFIDSKLTKKTKRLKRKRRGTVQEEDKPVQKAIEENSNNSSFDRTKEKKPNKAEEPKINPETDFRSLINEISTKAKEIQVLKPKVHKVKAKKAVDHVEVKEEMVNDDERTTDDYVEDDDSKPEIIIDPNDPLWHPSEEDSPKDEHSESNVIKRRKRSVRVKEVSIKKKREKRFLKVRTIGGISKKNPCSLCHKTFESMKELRNHKRKGCEAFTCVVCDKSFDSKDKMLSHINLHFTRCDVCDKEFCDSSTLRRHKQIHSGEKKYSCGICKKAFGRKDNLKDHVGRHLSGKILQSSKD